MALFTHDAQAIATTALVLPTTDILLFDVSVPQASRQIVQEIKTWRERLGYVFKHARIADFNLIENCELAIWREVMDKNEDVCFTSAKS